MELSITQRKILDVLYKNQGKWLSANQIKEKSGANLHHIKQALFKLMDNDCVFFDGNYKFQISSDGESALNS
jgi:hypothetical protein